MTLADFLLARIAEEEEIARLAAAPDPVEREEWELWTTHREPGRPTPRGSVEATPARVLAECEAKRQIVAEHPEVTVWHEGENLSGDRIDVPEWFCGTCVDTSARQPWTDVDRLEYPCPTLRFLALPYADHPDFDESWRP